MNSHSDALVTFGADIQAYFGKEYHPGQKDMVKAWLVDNTKAEDLPGLKKKIQETYQFRGSLPLIADLYAALKLVRAEKTPPPETGRLITEKERRESGEAWERIGKVLDRHQWPVEVPRELAGDVTLEDYRLNQTEFDEYLTHQAAERYCGNDCKSPLKGYHRTWKNSLGVHYFGFRKCTAWKDGR